MGARGELLVGMRRIPGTSRTGGTSGSRRLIRPLLVWAAAVLATTAQVSAKTLTGDHQRSYTSHAQRLRDTKLQGEGYHKHVPASSSKRTFNFSSFNISTSSEAGTDVSVQLRVFKVIEVSPAEGRMRLKVWLRMSWEDERLAWDPADYGNVTSVNYLVADQETTEIWKPDLRLYNSIEGTDTTKE